MEKSSDLIGANDTLARASILAYHEVLPLGSQYRYRVTVRQFQENLFFLCSSAAVAGDRPEIRITFDDGHRSNYEHALPLLEQFRIKATFFVLAGLVGTDSKYISWAQAREMSSAGHRIESHGRMHRMLTLCSMRELREEVVSSKQEIEDHLGVEVESISAPGGRWNQKVLRACADAGYKYLFHSNPWTSPVKLQEITLKGRHMVTNTMGAQAIQSLVETAGIRRMFWRARHGVKDLLQQTVGDQFYHRMWCWFANWTPADGLEVQVSGTPNKKDDIPA